MKYDQGVVIGSYEVGIVMNDPGVTLPGSACLNIPALIGEVGGGIPKVSPSIPCTGGSIINQESRAMCSSYCTSNYISVPCHMDLGYVEKGTEVLVFFVGGDITRPQIISFP